MGSYMGHEYADAPSAGVAPAPAEQVQGGGRYRVGDRVRVVDDVGGGRLGDIAAVIGHGGTFENDDVYYDLDGLSDGACILLERRLQPAFRPGDRVRLNRHSGIRMCGERGTVSSVLGDNVCVRMDEASSWGSLVAAFPADALDWERAEDCVQQAKPKFKVGDRVVTSGVPDAGVGVVTKVEDGWYSVKFETWYGTCGEQESRLSLAPTAAPCPQDNEQPGYHETFARLTDCLVSPQPCIVALVKNGQPRPSTWPFVHPSVAAATTEAERLARNNPGQEFAVYQRVAGRTCETTYNMKEVA